MSANQTAWTEVSPVAIPQEPKRPRMPNDVSYGVLWAKEGHEDYPQWLMRHDKPEDAVDFAEQYNALAAQRSELFPNEGTRVYWAVSITTSVEVI